MSYPDNLPAPLSGGYSFSFNGQAVKRTEMDNGSFSHSRRSRGEIAEVSLSWEVDPIQRKVLEGYLWHEGGSGQSPIPVPLSGGILQVKQITSMSIRDYGWKSECSARFEVSPSTSQTTSGLPSWPNNLPQTNGGNFELVRAVSENTPTGDSPSAARRRFQTFPQPYKLSLVLSQSERDRFLLFYLTEIGGMSGWFTFPIPGRGNTRCRLTSTPQEKFSSGFYQVSLELESEFNDRIPLSEYLSLRGSGSPEYFSPGWVQDGYTQ